MGVPQRLNSVTDIDRTAEFFQQFPRERFHVTLSVFDAATGKGPERGAVRVLFLD